MTTDLSTHFNPENRTLAVTVTFVSTYHVTLKIDVRNRSLACAALDIVLAGALPVIWSNTLVPASRSHTPAWGQRVRPVQVNTPLHTRGLDSSLLVIMTFPWKP